VTEDKFDILQVFVLLGSFFSLGNHLHNFWKGQEITTTVNSFLLFYNEFQRKLVTSFSVVLRLLIV
jgi:hypothetical protein